MKYKDEITSATTIDELVDILEKEVNDSGFYDTVYLNDLLEQLKSPLIKVDKNGDRKTYPAVLNKLKQVVDIEYQEDKCWYKKK